jgi:thiol-disulfide isomerase/thioredoxin
MNTYSLRNQPLLWAGAIFLGLMGCVVITTAGIMWWLRQADDQIKGEEVAITADLTSTVPPALPTDTATPAPTTLPEPSATAEVPEANGEQADSSTSDSLDLANTSNSTRSTRDTLSLPKPTSEGVILTPTAEAPTPTVAAFDPPAIDPPTVYFFYGDWCGHSIKAAATVERVQARYGNWIEFVQVDVDRYFHYDSEFKIKSVPSFIWVDAQGRVINHTSGARPESYFDEVYQALVKSQDGQGPCTTPSIQVTWPPTEATISDKVYVYGTVSIPNFQYFKLEYWAANSSNWTYLLEKREPIENGEIFMLDTETVPEGRYGLRITAVEQSGNYPAPCEIWWTIDN